MFAKKSGRIGYRSNRRSNYKKNSSYTSSNKPRNRNNVSQLYDKYTKLAKEFSASGDRISAEKYFQFADHYSRLMTELGINKEEINIKEVSTDSFAQTEKDNKENNYLSNKDNGDEKLSSENNIKEKKIIEEDETDSLESVSFIAEPAKKKSIKIKKNTN